jgi:hypothetical protein
MGKAGNVPILRKADFMGFIGIFVSYLNNG